MQIIAQVIILSLPIPIVQVDFFKFYRFFLKKPINFDCAYTVLLLKIVSCGTFWQIFSVNYCFT